MLLATQNNTHACRPLWVDAPAHLACPDHGELLAALRARLGKERVRVGRASAESLGLRLISRGPRAVTLVLREGGSTIVERDVEVAEGECTALAHTLALIADSWLTAPQPRPRAGSQATDAARPQSLSPSPEKTVEPGIDAGRVEAKRDHATVPTPTTLSVGEAAPAPAPVPIAEVSPSAAPTEARAAHKTDAVLAGPAAALPAAYPNKAVVSTSREAPQAPVEPAFPARLQVRTWSITIAASAGAMVAIEGHTSWAGAGLMDLQVGYRRWLLGVRGAFESAADLDPSSGSMAVRYTPVGAYAGRIVAESDRFMFAALAGGGVEVLSARASGYSSGHAYTAIDPMAFAGLRGEWRLGGRFGVVATSDVALAFRRYQFSVANVGPVARTTRARAGFALGVAWHLR